MRRKNLRQQIALSFVWDFHYPFAMQYHVAEAGTPLTAWPCVSLSSGES